MLKVWSGKNHLFLVKLGKVMNAERFVSEPRDCQRRRRIISERRKEFVGCAKRKAVPILSSREGSVLNMEQRSRDAVMKDAPMGP